MQIINFLKIDASIAPYKKVDFLYTTCFSLHVQWGTNRSFIRSEWHLVWPTAAVSLLKTVHVKHEGLGRLSASITKNMVSKAT